ncbi:MAG: TSUP family transporter [Verrucomicrobia bacterium]|nr:TSUP family transporter [Verrucomicrobiota bacterium]
MQLEWWSYPLLGLAGLIAGLVDSVAGGGGLISVPVLLNLGLPVPLALGTNKFQASFGSVSASWHYARRGVVDLRACTLGIVCTLVGALGGALAVQQMDSAFLARLVPWLLVAILVYSIFRPTVGERDEAPRLREPVFFVIFGLGLGFYDGFFGPGVGSFWTIALIMLLGQNFTKATGTTKVMNATSNLVALAVFASAGLVQVGAGLAMGLGQVLGARLGSGLVVKNGVRFIRPLFLTMVSLTLVRLIWISVRH